MGKVAETETTTKKRKKGRPSLLEIQKRSLKQQQQQHPNPNSSNARSTRRNPSLHAAPESAAAGDDDDVDERTEKKHKLLHGLNSNSAPDWNADTHNPLRSRRIGAGSDETEEKVSKATHTRNGSLVLESGPTTPLPDKKLLVFILDRLQKKDTYGVFSDPVDPEELPDYHDIIEHPMDFGTVRSKLDEGAYTSLEQFEKDVFLICSNAMQYNAPDTVFFRQARSMQELAKKDFDNLRQDSDNSEPQPKVARRGRPPGKNLKKSLGRSSTERVGPEFSSDATLATGGDNGSWPNTYNLRKMPTPDKFQVADASVRSSHASHNSEAYGNWMSELENEFPASVLKAVLKYGKKPFTVDENRRASYQVSLASEKEPSVFNTLEGSMKQLMAVGVQTEHGYSRSLARFAADLGPHAWMIASKKIESVLPNGVDFGPGWVGENDVPVRQQLCSGKQISTSYCVPDDINRLLPPNTSGPSSIPDRSLLNAEGTLEGLNSQKEIIPPNGTINDETRPMPNQIQQDHTTSHDIMNGSAGGFMHNFPPEIGMVATAGTSTGHGGLDEASMPSQMQGMVAKNFASTDGRLPESSRGLQSRIPAKSHVTGEGKSPWQGLPVSKDPNMRSPEPGYPSSKLGVGSPRQQQPDLALQL